MEGLFSKILVGTGLLIATYLVVTNPNGVSVATNSISGAYNSGVKTLQARA